MAKKIKKSKLDFLLNQVEPGRNRAARFESAHGLSTDEAPVSPQAKLLTVKERKTDEKKRPSKGRSVPEPKNTDEAGEERPGWYSQTDTDEAQNAKKVKRFPKFFKRKQKVPEVTPLQSGSVDIMDILSLLK